MKNFEKTADQTPTNSPEKYSAVESLTNVGDYAAFDTSRPLASHIELALPGNRTIEADVVANISTTGGDFAVATKDGYSSILRMGQDGLAEDVVSIPRGMTSQIRSQEGIHLFDATLRSGSEGAVDQVRIARTLGANDGMVLEYDKDAISAKGNIYEERKYRDKEARKSKLVKRIGAVMLAYGIFSSGGALDSAMDGFNNAGSTVMQSADRFYADGKIDGVDISAEQIEQFDRPVDAVVRTMDDLDAHNYDAIRSRSNEFITNNPGEIMLPDDVHEIENQLKDSHAIDEVAAAMKRDSDFYGIPITVSSEQEIDAARNTATEIHKALTTMPKSLVGAARLSEIEISSKSNHPDYNDTATAAYYDGNSYKITMFSRDKLHESVIGVGTFMPGTSESASTQGVFYHEFSHALAAGGIDATDSKIYGSSDQKNADASTPKNLAVDFIMGGIASYPQAPSTYSRTNRSENQAENMAGVLDSSRRNGIVHPDEARLYQSPSNRAQLRALVSLEEALPGIADYLVANNPNLVK